MTNESIHVGVCICTYKRPQFLKRLLEELADQETDGRFTHSIVVVDNDYLESAKHVVEEIADRATIGIRYYVEPRQNIARARNKAIENAPGNFVAFLDDDEFPTKRWLLTLMEARQKYGVDGVLGPVKPHFEQAPPRWVVEGRFYERPTYPTGYVIDGRKGRTGNVLLRRELFSACEEHFRPQFQTGEDQDFFRRMIEKGYVFIWCNEAVAYEVVPPARWTRAFMLKRALLRGANALLHPTFGAVDIVKSLIAIPTYLAILPVALLSGQARFMRYLVKIFDHLGRLLALVGIHPIREAYVLE
ncbi:MAG TPA: glycosyltransferase family 2 protein [Terriglobales bacterium]|nr:glycosyltransferase family 2 protein [Terriglobales bacterium]